MIKHIELSSSVDGQVPVSLDHDETCYYVIYGKSAEVFMDYQLQEAIAAFNACVQHQLDCLRADVTENTAKR